jgi:hypothetical protein
VPHICPPVTLFWQQVLMLMVIYTLHTQGPRFVESHICQNRADMGHPSFVTQQAVRNALRKRKLLFNQGRPVRSAS